MLFGTCRRGVLVSGAVADECVMWEGHRVIHGVAGSGKTMILGYRAQYLAKHQSPQCAARVQA